MPSEDVPFCERRLVAATAFLIDLPETRTPHALRRVDRTLRLLYAADRLSYARRGRPIVGGTYAGVGGKPACVEAARTFASLRVTERRAGDMIFGFTRPPHAGIASRFFLTTADGLCLISLNPMAWSAVQANLSEADRGVLRLAAGCLAGVCGCASACVCLPPDGYREHDASAGDGPIPHAAILAAIGLDVHTPKPHADAPPPAEPTPDTPDTPKEAAMTAVPASLQTPSSFQSGDFVAVLPSGREVGFSGIFEGRTGLPLLRRRLEQIAAAEGVRAETGKDTATVRVRRVFRPPVGWSGPTCQGPATPFAVQIPKAAALDDPAGRERDCLKGVPAELHGALRNIAYNAANGESEDAYLQKLRAMADDLEQPLRAFEQRVRLPRHEEGVTRGGLEAERMGG